MDVSDFTLGPGVTGIAIHNVNYSSAYTNGTGANQVYSNSDLTLTIGTSSNVFLSAGTVFTPRVWNGTFTYNVVPEPGPLALLAVGGLAVGVFRWRKVGQALRHCFHAPPWVPPTLRAG